MEKVKKNIESRRMYHTAHLYHIATLPKHAMLEEGDQWWSKKMMEYMK